MPFYKESKKFLTKENINYIENVILNDTFPFYRVGYSVSKKDKCSMLFHLLLKRPEHKQEKSYEKRINSIHYENILKIVESFFKKFNIKYKEILRMSINFSYNNGCKKCDTHVDHEFPHKQLIIYLNDADPCSKTVILNKNKKVFKKITPEKYKGICFESLFHYHFYPKKGERIILITTFKD